MFGKVLSLKVHLGRIWSISATVSIATLSPLTATAAPLPQTVTPLHYDLVLKPDLKGLTFSGDEKIDILVRAATKEIVLNAFRLDIRQVSLRTQSGLDLGNIQSRFDERDQTMHLALQSAIKPGRYRLLFAYHGSIQQNGSGLFALDEQGKRYLFTQLEPADARRLMPSWDEPSFKATFTLSTVVPSGSTAISNTPVTSDRTLDDALHRVTFAPTRKMSTYLLFLAVGDFERRVRVAGGVELGTVTRRGVAPQADFALDSAAKLLPWFNAYFAYRFPLPKLDNVAGPGESLTYGAMENWGAIFSFEQDFLIDPRAASERQRQRVFTTVAHEMAHQWFGDLVTMRWWDDLWLNEGFASWMEQEAGRRFHPEWSAALAFMRGRDLAMDADALDTSHPVVQPVKDAAEALQSFDFITYFKGEAAIRMLEAYVGPQAWQAGLRTYVARHAYGNATSADLWASMRAASGRPVDAIAHDITRMAGLPMVEASAVCSNGRMLVSLTEKRFHNDGRNDPGPGWHLPVFLGHPGVTPQLVVLDRAAQVSISGCGPIIVNAGQKSYFRTDYSPPMLSDLSKIFPKLDEIDQLALLSDTAALGLAGTATPAAMFELIANLGPNSSATTVSDALSRWDKLNGYAEGDDQGRLRLRDFAETAFLPRLSRLGWAARPGESAEDANLRDHLIATLGGAGVPAVIEEARREFARTNGPMPSLPILTAVSRNATPAEWERIRTMALEETSPQIRASLFEMLGRTHDDALATRALELSITDAPGETTGPRIIEAVSVLHPLEALRFAIAHRQTILQRLDSFSAPTFLADLASGGHDQETLSAVQAYCLGEQASEVKDACATSEALIQGRIRVRRAQMPILYSWLAARG
ncbi:M1 family metallopeptidase [Sphingobium sp. PNB]|uniref:M1 family metallopeptidase n=1 Tax=Sphingobium sp. PNB TaxID=863934 RepID=UPI001CA3FA29|nr:M1 family metallopeptidase [Sphingobium sp. PNB]MCB4859656.1 M1 family metallopeptidase [Sphingobium sp. PNB]